MKLAALIPCLFYLASAAAVPVEERAKSKVPNPVTFKQAGTFTFTSPLSTVASWTISCVGAQGGSGGQTNGAPNAGGFGGEAQGTFLLYPNIAYNVTIGQAGGSGASTKPNKISSAGGGGGASSVFLVGYSNQGQTNGATQYFLTAGGGGGAGAGIYGNVGGSNDAGNYGPSEGDYDSPGATDNNNFAGGAGGGLTSSSSNLIVKANNGQNGYAATDSNFRQAIGRPGFGGFGGGGGGGAGANGGGGGGGGWTGGNAADAGNGAGPGYSYVQTDCTKNNNAVSGGMAQYASTTKSGNGQCTFTYYSSNTVSSCSSNDSG